MSSLFTKVFKKVVCSLVSASMIVLPSWSIAGENNMSAIGKESQQYGLDVGKKALEMAPKFNGENVTFDLGNGKTFDMNKADMMPTDKANVKYNVSQQDIETAMGIYDDEKAMDDSGAKKKEALFDDSKKDNPTVEGHAYAILTDMANRDRVDMSSDPMFEKTNETLEGLEEISKGFADCKADTQFITTTETKHIADYKECTQVLDRSGSCTIYHNYQAGVVQHYDGPYNLSNCGEGCTQLWIGRVGNDYWAGSCSVYEEWTRVKVPNPSAVTRAVFEYAKWDDYMQVWVGEPGKEELIWGGPDGVHVFPPETSGRCERGTSWERNPNVDVTRFFKNVKKNAIVNFKIRVSVTGRGEGFGRIKIFFDKSKAVHDESWTPTSCLEAAYGVQDGFATGSVKCVDNPTQSDGCAWIDGVHVCPPDLKPSPLKNITSLCKRVEVNADFNFYKGQMDCWIDINGEKQCPVNTGGNLNACDPYEKNPKCGFIKSTCTDGAKGASGQCYVNDVVYDCGEDVKVEKTQAETVYKCPGSVHCMGSECLDTTITTNKDFAKVNALMNAAQYMTQDMKCTGQDADGNATGQENVVCHVFSGTPGECKIAVGGVSNCCESQPGIGVGSYITMIRTVADLNSAANDLAVAKDAPGFIKDIAGGWVDLRGEAADVVKEGFNYISKPFNSYIDNIATEIFDPMAQAKEFIQELIGQIKKQCTDALAQMFRDLGLDGVADAIGGSGGSVGSSLIGETAGAMMTTIGVIYTAYVVAQMIIQIVYKCTEEEYELTSQRELKNCHYVGGYCRNKKLGVCIEKRQVYCCYKSPLSRIINEQLRLQGDILGVEFDGFGTPKNPKCTGVPLDRIHLIDWDRVNLDEWIAILETNGQMPTEDSITLDKLTGTGSKLDFGQGRDNTIERLEKEFVDMDIDGVRTEGADHMDVDTGAVKTKDITASMGNRSQ